MPQQRSASTGQFSPFLIFAAFLGGCTASPAGLQTAGDLKVASVELASGSPEASLRISQAVVGADPGNVMGWVLAGNAEAELGQSDVAQASFTRALRLNPHMIDAALGLAKLKLQHEPAGAARDLQMLAKQKPDDARIWTDLGVAYDLQGMGNQAQGAYRQAMQRDPALVAPQADLGLSLALSGHAQDGLTLLRPLLGTPQSTARVRADFAVVAALAGDGQAASMVLGQDLPADQVSLAMRRFAEFKNAP